LFSKLVFNMANIEHCTRVFGDLSKMVEIPSEYIEPYLKTFLSMQIESIGLGYSTPAEARADLKGVEHFVSIFCGIHSRFATSNEYNKFCSMSDEQIIEICKKVCK
jgi:hypothetical protein